MPTSTAIGVNLRVTGHSSQGGRKYMEDFFSVAYQQSEDQTQLEYAFFGIFDGHGGSEAAFFAKEHLMRYIVQQKLFWSANDDDVCRAIREGYIATHNAMWRELEKWPRTASGLLSTAGTTATVAFIRHGKLYIGHVGDSGIVLGYEEGASTSLDSPFSLHIPNNVMNWTARALTQDHKPESNAEKERILSSGGKVVAKSGVSRVVWTRPKLGHKGPIRRSTPIDEIPFLAVARSLGDLWSYNSQLNEFVVSPEPDVHVVPIDPSFKCLIFGTDGLWNVLSASAAIDIVRNAEQINERNFYMSSRAKDLLNPSRCLVDRALEKWSTTRVRADNTTVVTVLLDPPSKKSKRESCSPTNNTHSNVEGTHIDDYHPSYDNHLIDYRDQSSAAAMPSRNMEVPRSDEYYSDPGQSYGQYNESYTEGMESYANYSHQANTNEYNNLPDYGPPHASTSYGQVLPTFSNLIDDAASSSSTYLLTRLETRMEQLSSSSMYTNYQQLMEAPSSTANDICYSPQMDLINTINSFHDYAGVNVCDSSRYANTEYEVCNNLESNPWPVKDANGHGTASTKPINYNENNNNNSYGSCSSSSGSSSSNNNHNIHINSNSNISLNSESVNNNNNVNNNQNPDVNSNNGNKEEFGQMLSPLESVYVKATAYDQSIQINEITSSGSVATPPPPPLPMATDSENVRRSVVMPILACKEKENRPQVTVLRTVAAAAAISTASTVAANKRGKCVSEEKGEAKVTRSLTTIMKKNIVPATVVSSPRMSLRRIALAPKGARDKKVVMVVGSKNQLVKTKETKGNSKRIVGVPPSSELRRLCKTVMVTRSRHSTGINTNMQTRNRFRKR